MPIENRCLNIAPGTEKGVFSIGHTGSQISGRPIARDAQVWGRTTKICQYFTIKHQGWSSSMPEGHPKYEDESGTLDICITLL